MENGVRLIDAEALWKKLELESWYDNADRDEIALPIVDSFPTVDSVEVVHGRWQKSEPGYSICSHCKADVAIFSGHRNYCRAKMTGDVNV